jgi:WhiB family transcriptional regulator, redox-sensing transcriptional regulator
MVNRDWMVDAACRDIDNPEIFFPDKVDDENAMAARAICRTCPVARKCYESAVAAGERHGVWGGYGHTQRSAILRRVQRTVDHV